MERVLDIYQRAYDPQHPVVCFDETSKQHIKEVIEPLPTSPGNIRKEDSEYVRGGTSNLFMFFEPLAGKRYVQVTSQRTAIDFAQAMKFLADEIYPDVPVITVVMDNLNTHTKASLYKAFMPEEAKRLSDKLIFEFTPKRGSWLNMAEIEFSALSRQCLSRRIADRDTLIREIHSWCQERNEKTVVADWQFRIDDARTKLKNLYPEIKVTV